MFSIAVRSILIVGVALAAAGCSEKAPSANSQTANSADSRTDAKTADHTVRAYIDPKTGELRNPTPDELAQEAALEAQRKKASAANLTSEQPEAKEVVTPSGAIELKLDDTNQHPLKACAAKDGDVKVDHACESHSDGSKK